MLPTESLLISVPLFFASWWLIRRYVYGPLDPFLIALFTLSSSIGLMLYYLVTGAFHDTAVAAAFVAAHLAFLGGFVAGGRHGIVLPGGAGYELAPRFLPALLGTVICVQAVLVVYVARSFGLVILQSVPDIAKNFIFANGGGAFRRALPPLTLLTLAYSLTLRHERRIGRATMAAVLAVSAVLAISTGGKGALLMLFVAWAYQRIFVARHAGRPIAGRAVAVATVAVLVTLAGALGVLAIGIAHTTMVGREPVDVLRLSGNLLLNRFVAFGDIAMVYFPTGLYESFRHAPADYLNHVFADLLGMLRLGAYQPPLGADLVAQAAGSANEGGFGPNAQVYFVGAIYFGSLLGIVYSFLIGALVGLARRSVLISFRRTGADMIVFIVANALVYDLAVDFSYFLGRLYATAAVGLATGLIALVVFAFISRRPVLRRVVLGGGTP